MEAFHEPTKMSLMATKPSLLPWSLLHTTLTRGTLGGTTGLKKHTQQYAYEYFYTPYLTDTYAIVGKITYYNECEYVEMYMY